MRRSFVGFPELAEPKPAIRSDSPIRMRPLSDYPWLTMDEEQNLHLDVPLFLSEMGYPDTPENRLVAVETMRRVCEELFPGIPVTETE